MKVIEGVRNLPTPFSSSVLTIGNFDGVHLGHRALIEQVVSRAKEAQVPSVVMTFEPHPVKVLYPDRKLNRIFDFEDQREQLELLGVDALVVEPFSREFSQLTPDRYLQEWIYRPFMPVTLVVGYDFSFGVGRQGSIELLRERAREMGFQVEMVSPVKVPVVPAGATSSEDVLVSSTRIRQAVEAGDVKLANLLLGRRFYLGGIVEKGVGRGRTIGVPTANLRSTSETVPGRGVYCAWATVRGKRFKSMVNIGSNPTFTSASTSQAMSIEAHLLDFGASANPANGASPLNTEIYGETVKLEFVARLRDERKFSGAAELVQQIKRDIQQGAELLDAE